MFVLLLVLVVIIPGDAAIPTPRFFGLGNIHFIGLCIIMLPDVLNPEWHRSRLPMCDSLSVTSVWNLLQKFWFQELMALRCLQGQHLKLFKWVTVFIIKINRICRTLCTPCVSAWNKIASQALDKWNLPRHSQGGVEYWLLKIVRGRRDPEPRLIYIWF